jgi:hypothetical protein
MRKIAFLLGVMVLVGAGCTSGSGQFQQSSGYGRTIEPVNPYSSGSGHYAGFQWAENTGGICNGNSQSFNEGCEEYYNQVGDR